MVKRRASGARLRRAGMTCAVALAALGAAAPSGAQAQSPGDGKRVMLYTGTTGFRHTDGINNGRPIIQAKLQELGYTVDWEDCSGRAAAGATPTATQCNNAEKNPRIFTAANLARYDALVFLNMSWSWNTNNPGPLLEQEAQKEALIGYVQNGGGIAAMHNATDAGAGRSVWDWWDGSPCQGSREFLRCDHENSPPVIAGRSAAMAARWARMR